ncbi:MAG: nuclear transport factor 2 family protein [Gemmatimonadetes bacterium]|nr:nuclear transport factor 2 family protein [Gemmatimonadota bacterium]NNM05243.1 nuclear transport factor 2 family protein [Gemmatimonadota bacterium]
MRQRSLGLPYPSIARFRGGALLALVCVALSAGCDSEAAVRMAPGPPNALLDRWVDMWNSYDLDEVGELFLNDPRLTYFSSEKQGVIRGMAAVVEHHRGFGFVPGGDPKGTRLWLEDLTTDLRGDMAVVTGLWFFAAAGDTTGEPQKGPVTFVAVWDSGAWKFMHMNFSEYLPEELLQPS